MRLLAPAALWALPLIPLLVFAYRWLYRRPSPLTMAHAGTPLAILAARRRSFRSVIPPLLFLLAVTTLILGAARPVMPLRVPADRATIMLSMDISGSMRSEDIAPNRLEAAKAAAKAFVQGVPSRLRVGLVIFGGYALLAVPPGTDRARMIETIDGLQTIRRTAIGDGLLEAVAALPDRVRPDAEGRLPPRAPGPLPPGIVVLLSDGRSNTGMDPLQAAALAREQQVRVYTVGVGQPESSTGAWTLGGTLDEETLQVIAQTTGGAYYHASSAERLRDVYRSLSQAIGWERRPEEVSALLAGVGMASLLIALVTSLLFVRPVV